MDASIVVAILRKTSPQKLKKSKNLTTNQQIVGHLIF